MGESSASEGDKSHPVREIITDNRPQWLLKLYEDKFYTDSDSNTDKRMFERYLRTTLEHGNIGCHSFVDSFEDTDDSVEDFDTAQLSVNVTSDAAYGADHSMYDGTYIAPHCNMHVSNETLSITDIIQQDTDDGNRVKHKKYCDNSTFEATLEPNSTKSIDASYLTLFSGEEFVNATAPQDSIKLDAHTTLNLMKAPTKRHQINLKRDEIYRRKHPIKAYEDLFEELNTEGVVLASDSSSLFMTPQSSLKSADVKSTQSGRTSCQSFVSVAEEFLYEDTEAGVKLIERRCPTSAVVAR